MKTRYTTAEIGELDQIIKNALSATVLDQGLGYWFGVIQTEPDVFYKVYATAFDGGTTEPITTDRAHHLIGGYRHES